MGGLYELIHKEFLKECLVHSALYILTIIIFNFDLIEGSYLLKNYQIVIPETTTEKHDFMLKKRKILVLVIFSYDLGSKLLYLFETQFYYL